MLSPVKALLVMMGIVFGTGLLLQVPVYAGLLTGLQPPPVLSGTKRTLGDDSSDTPTDSPAGAKTGAGTSAGTPADKPATGANGSSL